MFSKKYILLVSLALCWLITSATQFSKEVRNITWLDKADYNVPKILPEAIDSPKWVENSVNLVGNSSTNIDAPMIAIVIDDMGLNKKWSTKAENLPAPITLSYLPYAENLPERTKKARQSGHELMLHMPMEASGHHANYDSSTLMTSLTKTELLHNLQQNLDRFDGYVGINNHMGSKMSEDKESLSLIMQELKKRGLLYLDSRTTALSLGESTAREYGLPTTRRDVFLDHEATSEFVAESLQKLEMRAIKNGTAIAIGHPKDVTITALKQWIPEMQKKGFRIVPVSEIVKRRIYDDSHPIQVVSIKD